MISINGAPITQEDLQTQGVPITNVVGAPPISSSNTLTVGQQSQALGFVDIYNWVSAISVLICIVGFGALTKTMFSKAKSGVKKKKASLWMILIVFLLGGFVGYGLC